MIRDFSSRLRAKFAEDSESMPMSVWIEKNTKLKKKPFSFEGYEFQRAIADDMHKDLVCMKCSQVGLALSLDTPILTTLGWSTMADLKVGDQVYDEQGKICTIEYVSPVYQDRRCYRITFDDGQSIVADADHKWYVEADRSFPLDGNQTGSGRPPNSWNMFHSGVLNTQTIFEKQHYHKDRNRFAIPNTQPLEGHSNILPVDPYFLGLWLGNGNNHAACITSLIEDAAFQKAELERRGHICKVSSIVDKVEQYTVNPVGCIRHQKMDAPLATMHQRLNLLGLMKGTKRIPDEYLKAKASVRLDVLRGLLDTDGNVAKHNGRVSFSNTEPELISTFQDLVHSLGFKTRIRWKPLTSSPMRNGRVIHQRRQVAEISFAAYTEDGVCLLPRKLELLRSITTGRPSEAKRRRITQVELIDTVPVRCISVDSPNHLFLAGKGLIPTHNTEVQVRKFLGFLKRTTAVTGIFTLPDDNMFRRLSATRVKPIVSTEPVFNMQDGSVIRSLDLYQIDQSFGYFTGNKESDATSIPADLKFHDELDLSDQEIISLFASRLNNSDYKISQSFSTPTYVGYGVDALYQISDQHEYLLRCEKCNHYNLPHFNLTFVDIPGLTSDLKDISELTADNLNGLDLSKARIMCEKCHATLNRHDPSLREWVPRRPGAQTRGYRVLPFSTARTDIPHIIKQLLDYKRDNNIRRWYNTVLAEAYNDENARMTEGMIKAVMMGEGVPDINSSIPVFIGIDVGHTCHVTLVAMHQPIPVVFYWKQVKSDDLEDHVAMLRTRYNIVSGCMDRHPETTLANSIRDLTGNTVMPVEYRGSSALEFVKDEIEQVTHVQGNRTFMLDAVSLAVRKCKIQFVGYTQYANLVIQHLQDMVRVEEPDKPAIWNKLTGNDHFFHSLAFALFAIRMRGAIDFLSADEDPRTMMIASPVNLKGPPIMGIHSRRKTLMQLGVR